MPCSKRSSAPTAQSRGRWHGFDALVDLAYDRNGNLTSDGEKHTYTFNLFVQLVRINDYAGGAVIARFTYNGLGQRISEQTDVNNAASSGEPDREGNSDHPVHSVAPEAAGWRSGCDARRGWPVG